MDCISCGAHMALDEENVGLYLHHNDGPREAPYKVYHCECGKQADVWWIEDEEDDEE